MDCAAAGEKREVMRQFDVRWWNTPEMLARRPHRETAAGVSWGPGDLAEEFSDLCYLEFQHRDLYRPERCPRCGGWHKWEDWMKRRQEEHPTLGIIPLCRDCGWPEAEDFYGSNIVVSSPRTAFKLTGDFF